MLPLCIIETFSSGGRNYPYISVFWRPLFRDYKSVSSSAFPTNKCPTTDTSNRPISQISQYIRQISHNAPFCNRNVHMCAHFCYKMVHCGIWDWRIVGFVQQVSTVIAIRLEQCKNGMHAKLKMSSAKDAPSLIFQTLFCQAELIFRKREKYFQFLSFLNSDAARNWHESSLKNGICLGCIVDISWLLMAGRH